VWGKPDGSLVWVPASDGPPSAQPLPPAAAAASEAPLPRPDPQPVATALGEARSGDAIPEGSVSPSLSLRGTIRSWNEPPHFY
jgi:breast cancer 2 susceptibility protein